VRRRLFVSCVLATLAAARPLSAAPPKDETVAQVKSIVARAAEAFSTGRFVDAGKLFLEAHELLAVRGLSIRPELLHNAGIAFDKAGDCEKSAELFARFLAARPAAKDSPEFTERLAAARACAPEVTIQSSPEGASVRVDGTPRGKAPLVVNLRTGSHQIELALFGYESAAERIEVRGPVTVARTLSAPRQEAAAPPPPPAPPAAVAPAPPPAAAPAPARTEVPVAIAVGEAPRPAPGRTWTWVSGIAGGGALALGATLGALASSQYSIYKSELDKGDLCNCRDVNRLRSAENTGKTLMLGANVSYVVAALGLGGAAALFFVESPAP
jgi:hypothetical protein